MWDLFWNPTRAYQGYGCLLWIYICVWRDGDSLYFHCVHLVNLSFFFPSSMSCRKCCEVCWQIPVNSKRSLKNQTRLKSLCKTTWPWSSPFCYAFLSRGEITIPVGIMHNPVNAFGECFVCSCHWFSVLWWKNKRFRITGVIMLRIYRGKKCDLFLLEFMVKTTK